MGFLKIVFFIPRTRLKTIDVRFYEISDILKSFGYELPHDMWRFSTVIPGIPTLGFTCIGNFVEAPKYLCILVCTSIWELFFRGTVLWGILYLLK